MIVIPRLLVVNTAVIRPTENKQSVDLVVINREASADFYKRFPDGNDRDLSEVMSYVRKNTLTQLGRPGVSHSARRRLELEGENFHLGDVLTEQEAFELGYHEPHIDTQCARIGQLEHGWRRDWSKGRDYLEDTLRSEGFITEDQTIVSGNGGLHVLNEEQADLLARGHYRIQGLNNAERPISIQLFDPKDGEIPVGCAVFVEAANAIYEFMTYPPVMEEKILEAGSEIGGY
jgi:hypothetical protein